MQININANAVTIDGNIKSISDFQKIKETLDSILRSSGDVVINIPDSISITSSVIGYFNKLVLKDSVNLTMLIGNSMLLELLNDLDLTSTFKARMA